MSVRARLDIGNASDSRYSARRVLRLGTSLAGSGEEAIIHDLSATGFLIETSAPLGDGETLQVELPEQGQTPASVVWRRGQYYGCEFAERVPAAVVSAAILRSSVLHVRPAAELPAVGEVANRRGEQPSSGGYDDKYDEDYRYSARIRMLLMLGLAAASWLIIALAAYFLI